MGANLNALKQFVRNSVLVCLGAAEGHVEHDSPNLRTGLSHGFPLILSCAVLLRLRVCYSVIRAPPHLTSHSISSANLTISMLALPSAWRLRVITLF